MLGKNPFKTKIGIALGGGGARGIAHIGVLKAIGESHHDVDCIAGTSAGALIATLYAFGMNLEKIRDIFTSLSVSKLGLFRISSSGFMDGNRIADIVREYLGEADIRDARIPLGIVCCDLASGKNVIFTSGPAPLLVQASASFPGLFSPVQYQGYTLVDGFLTENVPVSALKALGANFSVAVNLSAASYKIPDKMSIKDTLFRSFDILVDRPQEHTTNRASYTINLDMSFIDRFRVSEVDRAISLGYDKTQIMLSKSPVYWYLKPFLQYFKDINQSVKQLVGSLVRRPSFRLPGFRKIFSKKSV